MNKFFTQNHTTNPVWRVAKFETIRQLKKPAFWASILILPLFIGLIYFISFVTSSDVANVNPTIDENTKLAITDDAGILAPGTPYLIDGDKEQGIEMVKNGDIDLYFYIPADFIETRKADFYHISEGLDIFNFDANILKSLLAENAAMKVDPLDVIALTGNFEITDNKLTVTGEDANALGKAIIPLAILVVFFMYVALFGNRFLMATVEEKENRVSEMILTSISSKHLIIGKILAMLALGVIQILTFIVPICILVFINRDNSIVGPILSSIEIDPVAIAMNLVLFVASVVFYAGTCTFVGSLVSTARDASSFIGPAIIAMVFPLYFMQFFFVEPGPVVYFLTYFPLSAPIALMLRSGFGTLGTLEFCIGLAEVTIMAVIMIRLAIVTFQKNAINFDRVRLKFPRKR
ncbi:ABC transporter permease [Candidatus Saccharibacteria bacterium]|nr:ABC transporter permease [Candidatus Saccharibacteria bacterium]